MTPLLDESVQSHYACPDLAKKIRAGIERSGKNVEDLSVRDLGPVDQLHTGGGPATLSLMEKAGLHQGAEILDAGCGIGGSSRLIAEHFKLNVTGIDLAPDFVDTAGTLTRWCGLDRKRNINFRQGSVLDLPCEDLFFDAVLCQHILMNIRDKATALAEFYRVLKPGGKLILHEITDGPGPAPRMPVPWAADTSISFLTPWKEVTEIMEKTGFTPEFFSDETGNSALWWKKVNAFTAKSPPRPLNPGIVFGDNAALFGPNMEINFSSRSVCCIEAILIKP
ncbi:MAG: class I SAM-dependent methyltransferase [Desulfobacterales bacterium]|nr:class I SAM-dependent methyltransferase [Desulfobacterales bacterium]